MKHASFSVFILCTRGGIFQQKECFFGTRDPAWKHWCKVTARVEVQSRETRWDAHSGKADGFVFTHFLKRRDHVLRHAHSGAVLNSLGFLQSSSCRTTPVSNASHWQAGQLCKQFVSVCSCFCWPIVHTFFTSSQTGWLFFIDLKDLTATSRCYIFIVFSCYTILCQSVPYLLILTSLWVAF